MAEDIYKLHGILTEKYSQLEQGYLKTLALLKALKERKAKIADVEFIDDGWRFKKNGTTTRKNPVSRKSVKRRSKKRPTRRG